MIASSYGLCDVQSIGLTPIWTKVHTQTTVLERRCMCVWMLK